MSPTAPPTRWQPAQWRLRTLDFWVRAVIVVALLAIVVQSSPALSQIGPGASLTVVQGSVSVTRFDGTAIYPAGSGLTLSIGDIVGTLERTRAIVTFFSGSEVELGSNTTIVIRRLDRDLLDQANVTIENLSGATLIRVPDDAGPNPGVRVLGRDTVAVIRAGEIGHGVDPTTNNVTAACVDGGWLCTRESATFPNEQTFLVGQTSTTVTGSGQIVVLRIVQGASIWNALADGGALGTDDSSRGRPGSERDRRNGGDDDDDDPGANQPANPTHTPTTSGRTLPQGAVQPWTPTPTITPTPTSTFTPTPSQTPTGTLTPTSTLTPTATATATLTPTATFTPTATLTPTLTPTATSTPFTGAPCGTPQNQLGGAGTFAFGHNLGQTSGIVHLEWNAFPAGDQFEILYQGAVLFSTFDAGSQTPFVSGPGTVDVPFGPGASTTIVIRVTTGPGSTQWQYEVGCLP